MPHVSPLLASHETSGSIARVHELSRLPDSVCPSHVKIHVGISSFSPHPEGPRVSPLPPISTDCQILCVLSAPLPWAVGSALGQAFPL